MIEKGQLDRVYKYKTDENIALWRSLRTDVVVDSPLFPDFYKRETRPGKFRLPDVTIKKIGNIEYVFPKAYQDKPNDIWRVEGTSLFDVSHTMRGDKWVYFEIPAGTDIPKDLLVIMDDYNKEYKATHYTIAPAHLMTLDEFKKILRQFAMNAQKRKEALKHG